MGTTLTCLWFLSFSMERNSWQDKTFSFKIKQLVKLKKKSPLHFWDIKWLLQRRTLIGFSRRAKQKQSENISFCRQMDFRTGCKEQTGQTWGAVEAEVSASIWLNLGCLLLLPRGKQSNTSGTAARLHATTGKHAISSHRKICANMPTCFGKIKDLPPFIFLALYLQGSEVVICGLHYTLQPEFISSAK